jgi:Mg-chelatase subunit ChlD
VHTVRRAPKTLDRDPVAYEAVPTGGGGGIAFVAPAAHRPGRDARPAGRAGAGQGVTDEQARLVPLPGEQAGRDVEAAVLARAREIAARLALRPARHDRAASWGRGEPVSVRYRGRSDDIDLDRTLEVLAERPHPAAEDVIVREPARARRAVVLVVDVSGSMRGERVRTAAATVGALAGELADDDLGVLAFWSDAVVLARPGQRVSVPALVDRLVRIPAKGLTNVAFPLQLAAGQLADRPTRDARVVLLSDCVHNAGPDPRPLAARLPRLDVLVDVSGEHDLTMARALARTGHGRALRVAHHRDVAPALSALFAG